MAEIADENKRWELGKEPLPGVESYPTSRVVHDSRRQVTEPNELQIGRVYAQVNGKRIGLIYYEIVEKGDEYALGRRAPREKDDIWTRIYFCDHGISPYEGTDNWNPVNWLIPYSSLSDEEIHSGIIKS